MQVAVARRPVENFQTEVPLPDWDLGAEEDIYNLDSNGVAFEPLVDENGNPLPNQPMDQMPAPGTMIPPQQPSPSGTQVDQQWLDRVLPPRQGQGGQQQPPQPQPQVVRPPSNRPSPGARSVPAPDPLEPRPDTSEQ